MNSLNLFVAGFLSLALAGVPGEAERETAAVVLALRQAESVAEMDAAVGRFNQEQVDLVQDLINLLRESKAAEIKVRACFLLGSIRSPRASRVLVENLLVEADVQNERAKIPLWGRYPCQEALISIGKPAEHLLIEILSKPENDRIRAAALWVLQQAEGWRGAVLVLENAWDLAGGDARKELEKTLEEARKRVP